MTDHPIPDDLLDALARAEMNHDDRVFRRDGDEEPWLASSEPSRDAYREGIGVVLTALAEWADGALIDPATWTRVRAERYENGVELCIVHDEVKVETHDPSGGCAEAWGADCETVPLYTLDNGSDRHG